MIKSTKTKKTPNLDDFAMAAGTDRGQDEPVLPWEDPRVRDDVKQPILLRLPEPLYLRIKFIAENSMFSMTSFIMSLIEEPINKMADDLAAAQKGKKP